MLEYDRLYTVEDVAQKTGLTDRTIRNYLKDGRLKGKKIGGQWRFTADDVEALFRTPGEDEETERAAENMIDSPCKNANPDVYTIIEYECEPMVSRELAARMNAEIDDPDNDFSGAKLEHTYNEKEKRARFVFRGSADFASAMLKIVRKQVKKG